MNRKTKTQHDGQKEKNTTLWIEKEKHYIMDRKKKTQYNMMNRNRKKLHNEQKNKNTT